MTTKNGKKLLNSISATKIFSIVAVFSFFLLFGFILKIIFSDVDDSDATTTSASAGSSVYSASISNDDTVSIPVVPTASQAEYTASNNITFSSTCTAGSYIYINTSSTNNSLTRTGSDTGVKTIAAVAGGSTSGLTDNTWGYKVNGNAFTQVPVSGSPAVLYSSTTAETNKSIPVTYGVKVDNSIPSGVYSNDVVYTMVVDNKCLQYTLSFVDEDGTTKLYPDINVNYGDNVNLNNYTPTKSGYTFAGWINGSSTYTGNTNPNPSNAMVVKLGVKWNDNYKSMQGFSCASISKGNTVTLRDLRDKELYTVFRATSGKCWMSQDLRIVGPLTITSADSDIVSNFTLPAPEINWSADSIFDSSSVGTNKYGAHYNYYAATGGTVSGDSFLGEAEHSICPRGWKIPAKTEWDQLFTDYSIANSAAGSIIARSAPIKIVYSGVHMYGSTVNDVDETAHLWSATSIGDSYIQTIYFSDSQATTNGGTSRMGGRSVRCIARS